MLSIVTSVSDNDVLFETEGQSLWTSGSEAGIYKSFSKPLLDLDLSPVSVGGYASTWGLKTGFKASFSAGLELGLGGYFEVGAGNVAVDYQADLTVDAKNPDGTDISSLSAGDSFIVRAGQMADTDDIAMATEFARVEAGLSFDYDLYADATIKGKILSKTVVNTGFHVKEKGSQELVKASLDLGTGTFGLDLFEVPVLDLSELEFEDPETGILKGGLYVPALNTGVPGDDYDDSAWNGSQIVNSHLPLDRSVGTTRIDFFKVAFDLDAMLLYIASRAASAGGVGIGGGLSWSGGNKYIGYDVTLLDATLEAYLGVAQTMTFEPTMMVDLNFQDASENPKKALVETAPGSGIFEPVTTRRVRVGEDIEIIHPGGDLVIDTDYVLSGTFSNNTSIVLSPAFTLALMEIELTGGWGWLDWSESLYSKTFPLVDPVPVAELFDKSFTLGGFSEIDGGDLELQAAPPTIFTVLASADDETITEGEELVVSGTIFDPLGADDGTDAYTFEIDWKDGTTQTVTLDDDTTASVDDVTFDPLSRGFSAAHHYEDEIGTQELSFTATRTTDSTQTDDLTISVQVNNVAPTVSLDPLFLDNIGNATLTGSYADPGVQDTQTMTVAWGDGTSTPFNVSAISGLSDGQTFTSGSEVLTITSVDTATARVEFSVTGHRYGATVSSLLRGTVVDADGGTDWDQVQVPWGLNLAVPYYTPGIWEDDLAQVYIRFKDVSGLSAPQYTLVVDWDDDNNPAASTFSVDVNFWDFLFNTSDKYYSTTDSAVLKVENVNFKINSIIPPRFTFEPTFSVSRRYADDGHAASGNGTTSDVSNVVVNLFERDGDRGGTVIRPVTVSDVAPTLTLDPTEEVGAGGLALLSGTIDDDGRLDAFELRVDWGDGSTFDNDDDASTADDPFEVFTYDPSSSGSQTFNVPHPYTEDLDGGSYSVTATVYDDDGLSGDATEAFVVDFDKAPVAYDDFVEVDADQILVIDVLADNDSDDDTDGDVDPESSLDPALTTIVGDTDPTWAADLLDNNGDGTFTFDPTTAFASLPKGQTATVTFDYQIEDSENQTATAAVTITIVGVRTATAAFTWAPEPQDEGSLIQFTDQSIGAQDDPLSWSWDFAGLGTSTDQNPEFAFPDNDTYTVQLTVSDAGSMDTIVHDVTVLNVAPVIDFLENSSPGAGGVSQGEAISVSAGFTDPGSADTHTAIIDWGDGTESSGDVAESEGTGTVAGIHVYDSGGIYTVNLTVTDDDGDSDTQTTTVVVSGVGLHNGVLEIIGTNQNDCVYVEKLPRRLLFVCADFLQGSRHQRYNMADVEQIDMHLYGGRDQAALGSRVTIPAFIDGGDGRDTLKGGRGNDILLGGEGRDYLIGRSGRDLLIGGLGGDKLKGDYGEDILISGTTAYDDDAEALLDILAVWASAEDRDARVAALQDTNRPAYLELGTTVLNDASVDKLYGNPGQDWLFYDTGLDKMIVPRRWGVWRWWR